MEITRRLFVRFLLGTTALATVGFVASNPREPSTSDVGRFTEQTAEDQLILTLLQSKEHEISPPANGNKSDGGEESPTTDKHTKWIDRIKEEVAAAYDNFERTEHFVWARDRAPILANRDWSFAKELEWDSAPSLAERYELPAYAVPGSGHFATTGINLFVSSGLKWGLSEVGISAGLFSGPGALIMAVDHAVKLGLRVADYYSQNGALEMGFSETVARAAVAQYKVPLTSIERWIVRESVRQTHSSYRNPYSDPPDTWLFPKL